MPPKLTKKQKETLDFIERYMEQHGTSPALSEIAQEFSIKPPSAHKRLKTLARKGFIFFERSPYHGFYIRLLNIAYRDQTVEVPIIGSVSATGRISPLKQPYRKYVVTIQAESKRKLVFVIMKEDVPERSLARGDLLLIDRFEPHRAGDIAVVQFDDEHSFLVRYLGLSSVPEVNSVDFLDVMQADTTRMKGEEQSLDWLYAIYEPWTNTEECIQEVAIARRVMTEKGIARPKEIGKITLIIRDLR